MKALLIIAHGSRQAGANTHLEQLAIELEAAAKDRFSSVRCAYLQFNGPGVIESITELSQKGIRHITIFPFFLAAGGHVTSDIPETVRQAQAQFPEIVFETTQFLGGLKGLTELILDSTFQN